MVGEHDLQDSGRPFCPNCGVVNDWEANFCAVCGTALPPGSLIIVETGNLVFPAPYLLSPVTRKLAYRG